MAYYIVVHHPADSGRPYANHWNPAEPRELLTFTTPNRIAERAVQERRLFVHRCGFEGHAPSIVCEAEVLSADPIDRSQHLVSLRPLRVLDATPLVSPGRGQSDYSAPEPPS